MRHEKHILCSPIIWFLITIFIYSLKLSADNKPTLFKTLSVDEGLSQNTIWCIMQDKSGKMWIGTGDGLNRYDGYSFTTYYHTPDDSLSIANNHIRSLCTDAEGNIWIGTLVGLSRYNVRTNNFTNYSLRDTPIQVFAIIDMPQKDILFLATDNGLITFDKSNKKIVINPSLGHLAISSMCKVDNELYLGTSQGVFVYSIDNQNVRQILPELKDIAIASIIYDSQSRHLWIGSLKKGIYHVDNQLQIIRNYRLDEQFLCTPANTIRVLKQYTDGKIWIGSTEALFIFDPTLETFERYQAVYGKKYSLSNNSVRSLFIDNQKGVWVGTFYGGLNYYHPLAPAFNTLKRSTVSKSLNDHIISCIVEEPSTGNLWIGTNDGGINYYNRKDKTFKSYQSSEKGLRSNNIKAILPEETGNIYVGTHSGGLSYIHVKTGQVENFKIPHMEAEDNSCYVLLDNQDHIWVGAMTGLILFDKSTKQFRQHPLTKENPGLSGVLINNLFRDSRNRVWIATEKGLFLYSDKQKVTPITDQLSNDLSSYIIAYCVEEDIHKNIWVASTNGLYQYSSEGIFQRRYTIEDGLPNNCIYGLLEDNMNRLWLSTNKGLSCFDIQTGKFHNYKQEDGLSHNEFNQYGYCKGSNNILYFGGLDGITYFEPFRFTENPFAPQPEITGISILNQPVTYTSDKTSQVSRDAKGNLKSISFPFSLRQFNIQYTVSNYLSGKRNEFAYQLEGFDKGWNYTSDRNVSYSNLSPGKYIFKVKACNNNGKWCDTPTEFLVHITPMWYQTWIAKTVFTLCFLGLAAFIVYFFIARAKMRMRMQMEHYEYCKNEEINQEKVKFYMNMSHELRTPLSLIITPLEELIEQDCFLSSKTQSKLKFIYQNSHRLLHIINQLLDFRKAEAGALPLQVELCDIEDWCMKIFSMFKGKALKRKIDYQFSSTLNHRLLPADKGYIETILINLLSNAFKFTPDNGQITVALREEKNNYVISVRDNGKGISQEKLGKIFERFYQTDEHHQGTGIGLSLVKCLVDKHRGKIEVESKVNQFTEFNLSLPNDIHSFSKPELISQTTYDENRLLQQMKELEPEFDAETPEEEKNENSKAETDINDKEEKPVILLVDDNQEMLKYLKNALINQYQVIIANNGKIAIEIMKNQEVDIVLSDVMMPEINGLKLCEMIKRNLQTCHIPVILLSAKSSLDDQTSGIELGADDYIGKPFSMTLLKGKINNILKSKERIIHFYQNNVNVDTAEITSNSADNEFVRRTIQIIEENISNDNFSTDDLANQLCMSRSNLYIKMNSIAGEPPANFIRRIRFNKVCKLLLEEKYSIAEISYMTGFSSPSYLSNSFKKFMGMLPSEYIKEHRNNG